MSEHQYYEFAAIDRPLTRAEMAELRAVSTRAEITSAGFANHYEWGDLKADPADWMRRYFDAFVYTANWCSCRLALRVPLATFHHAEVKAYTATQALTIKASDEHWICDWSLDESDDYERFAEEDGNGWMRRLLPLRDELLRGDLRPLYLGWLAGAGGGDLRDDTLEPEIVCHNSPGLSELSPAQQALAEFLAMDPDMLTAASAGSGRAPQAESEDGDRLDAWLGEWSREEMASVLRLIAQGRHQEAERSVRSRHVAWLKAQQAPGTPAMRRRSVAELLDIAKTAAGLRLEREAKERAKQEAERRRQREVRLRQVMAEVDKHWEAIDAQAKRATSSGYEHAVRGLLELAEAYALTASGEEFEHALRHFVVRHAKRSTLLRRLTGAGLWSG